MQNIVGSLVLDRPVLGVPISTLSPWLDMLIRTDDEVFGLLDAQPHRRWIKTHTPLDGLPLHPTVTYIAVIRHPLDVALSDRDHRSNMDQRRALELRAAAAGTPDPSLRREPEPLDVVDYLRWFIDNDVPPTGSGPNGLADFCQQATTYWEARNAPNVHLFHYTDLWENLAGEMRLVANVLDITVDEVRWPEFVEAAALDSMRDRAADTAPDFGVRHAVEVTTAVRNIAPMLLMMIFPFGADPSVTVSITIINTVGIVVIGLFVLMWRRRRATTGHARNARFGLTRIHICLIEFVVALRGCS